MFIDYRPNQRLSDTLIIKIGLYLKAAFRQHNKTIEVFKWLINWILLKKRKNGNIEKWKFRDIRSKKNK